MLLPEVICRLKAFEERTTGKLKQHRAKEDQLLLTYAEWQDRSKGNRDGDSRSTGGRSSKSGRSNCNKGRGLDFKNHSSSNKKGKYKSQIKCFRCDVYGNYASECPQKDKEQEANLKQTVEDEPALLMAAQKGGQKELVFLNESKVNPENLEKDATNESEWYLDNGASNHMIGNKGAFSVLDSNVGGKIRFGDRSTIRIEGRGSIVLRCKNGEQRVLSDVYSIPQLRSNILSIGQATEGGCVV